MDSQEQLKPEEGNSELDDEALHMRVLQEHPQYATFMERYPDADAAPDGVNPWLHIATHEIVERQIAGGEPAATRVALEELLRLGYDRHEAIHRIGYALTGEIFEMLRGQRPFDDQRFSRAIEEVLTQSRLNARQSRRKRRRRSRRR